MHKKKRKYVKILSEKEYKACELLLKPLQKADEKEAKRKDDAKGVHKMV